jgi:hypothetical protein
MASPTSTSSSTSASSASIGTDTPTLGGAEPAFTAKYGEPAPRYIYAFTASTGERAILYLGLLHLTTGQIRTQTIVVQRLTQVTWDASMARTVYEPFFPPDAESIGDITSPAGVHHLFHSLLLAHTVPLGAFVGTGGKQLAAGTFDVLCGTTLITNVHGSYSCGLTIGEWPIS